MKLIFIVFLIALVSANLVVKYFGAPGLWIASAVFIPFDFVCRCLVHERYSGKQLFLALFLLTCAAAAITVLVNWDAKWVALASVAGFCAAQVAAGVFYQLTRGRSWFLKVNGSDLVAVVLDSIVFQYIAFSVLDPVITAGQILIKFIGGLIWYFILFKVMRLGDKIQFKRLKNKYFL